MDKNSEQRTYLDLSPESKWTVDENGYTLLINLPDFQKEQTSITISNSSNTLSIKWESPVIGNPWWRFHRDFPVPENCNVDGVKAKYKDGLLYVIFPKLINGDEGEGEEEEEIKRKSKYGVGRQIELIKGISNPILMLNVVAILIVLLVLWMSLTHKRNSGKVFED
ncbi:hypothetical protein J5N97_010839 [Dioscorea zingiberensis]|uniref:SHSP domain-containing protein n=1 Tax=Dioscorea zingiberensis TaxID=325984 RepID=A0A9D5D131_9LILI|nr:hypothetical protein J5N97_010839 [Dioscorea zingiberensis]